jgi:ribosome-associated heat shock protein Hsp15
MADQQSVPVQTIRLDKWLWHARVTKSRAQAKKLVSDGKIRLNRIKTTTPSQNVKAGDVLTIRLERTVLVYEIVSPGTRRGPYSEACQLYHDLSTPALENREDDNNFQYQKQGKPNQRDRRTLARLRGKDFPR